MRRIWEAVLRVLGLSGPSPVCEAIKRVDAMDAKARDMEYVTMSWTAADMTEEQQRAAGLIE